MGLFDKLKAVFSGVEEERPVGCDADDLGDNRCAPEEFDDYTEVDSTKVDSLEGAPR